MGSVPNLLLICGVLGLVKGNGFLVFGVRGGAGVLIMSVGEVIFFLRKERRIFDEDVRSGIILFSYIREGREGKGRVGDLVSLVSWWILCFVFCVCEGRSFESLFFLPTP